MINWHTGTDKNNNSYFYYPDDEEEFKKGVSESLGFYLDILDSDKNLIMRKEVKSSEQEWESPVLTYIKTMNERGQKLYKYYKNCYFYAVPKNLKNLLPGEDVILEKENKDTLSLIQKYLAIEMLYVVEKGQLRIEYNELTDIINKKYGIDINPHTQLPNLIGDISKICYKELNLPMLSCIVVNKETQLPGVGFYKLYDELHDTHYTGNAYFEKRCRDKVKKEISNCNEWHKLASYLNIKQEYVNISNTNNIASKDVKNDEIFIQTETDENSIFPEEISGENYSEGAVKTILVNKYERNTTAKNECIKFYGTQCKVCGFKFSEKYGLKFENKIHVHHIKPISEIGEEYQIDPIKDLIPVCPNCHMILHSKGKNEVYTIEEVKEMIKNNL